MSRLHGTKDFWLGGAARRRRRRSGPRSPEAGPDAAVPTCPELDGRRPGPPPRRRSTRWVAVHAGRGAAPSGPSRAADARAARRPARPRSPGGATSTTGLIEHARGARPGAAGLELGAAGQEGRLLAPPDGARDLGAPLGRADGRSAAAEPIEAKLAADGVTEVLDTWLPAGRRQRPDRPAGRGAPRRHRRRPGVVRPAARRGRRAARHRHAPRHRRPRTPGRTRPARRATCCWRCTAGWASTCST